MDKLIVDIHADDYGYSTSTSLDILECLKAGKLDSISLMSNMKAFDESMDILEKEIPNLPFLPKMSVHLNIPEGISKENEFPMSWGKLFLVSYSFNRKKIKDALKKELKDQIDKAWIRTEKCLEIAKENNVPFNQHGLRLDSHIHTHLIPVVWDALMEVIEEEHYDVEYIRNPKEPLRPFLKEKSLWSSYSLINAVKNRILMFYSGKVDRYCEEKGMNKMYMWGLMMSGHLDYDRINVLLPEMSRTAQKNDRILELLFHPGKAKDEEYGEDMDKDYFRDANTSDNRWIEKDSVLKIENRNREEEYGCQ